ncbi:MAG: acylphosphatase [[Lactobacillus] timonensis]|jgi:acylphosphatase|nr:acylphosphatase [[Lactobacillus] timonensis]
MVNYHLVITGRVQGVGFRGSTLMVAREMGVTGYVANRVDGSVFVAVQGEPAVVKSFIQKMCDGLTPYARVDHVDVKPASLEHFSDFTVRF